MHMRTPKVMDQNTGQRMRPVKKVAVPEAAYKVILKVRLKKVSAS